MGWGDKNGFHLLQGFTGYYGVQSRFSEANGKMAMFTFKSRSLNQLNNRLKCRSLGPIYDPDRVSGLSKGFSEEWGIMPLSSLKTKGQ